MSQEEKKPTAVGFINEKSYTDEISKTVKYFEISLKQNEIDKLYKDVRGDIHLCVVKNKVVGPDQKPLTKLALVENTHYSQAIPVKNSFINIILEGRKLDLMEKRSDMVTLKMGMKGDQNTKDKVNYYIGQNPSNKELRFAYCGSGIGQASKVLGSVYSAERPIENSKENAVFFNAYLNKETLLGMEANSKGKIYIGIYPSTQEPGRSIAVQSLEKSSISNKPIHLIALNQNDLTTIKANDNGNIALTYVAIKAESLAKALPNAADMVVYVSKSKDAVNKTELEVVGNARTQKTMFWLDANKTITSDISLKENQAVSFSLLNEKVLKAVLGDMPHAVHGIIKSVDGQQAKVETPFGLKDVSLSDLKLSNIESVKNFDTVYKTLEAKYSQNLSKNTNTSKSLKSEKGISESKTITKEEKKPTQTKPKSNNNEMSR